jgi:hypothetical protein
MKVKELVEKVNSTKYWSLYSLEKDFEFNLKIVAHGLYVDKQRWYETSTTVYECEDGFVGVSGISQMYSDYMDYDDCECECFAEEFEQKQVITYVPVKK